MSKSIYEEALEDLSILVKQANKRKLSNDIVVNRWSLERIEKVINQAQKQEKLLSLYKELSNYVCEQCYAHKLPEITRLKILIKELENEKNT